MSSSKFLKIGLAVAAFGIGFLAVNTALDVLEAKEKAPAKEKVADVATTAPKALTDAPQIKVRHIDLTKANVTTLMDEVNTATVDSTIESIEAFNSKNDQPIYLILDSPGGSVLDGARLMSVIQASKNPVYSVNVGICASMCFMILEHSHKRFATNRSTLMGHPASVGVQFQGELDKLVSRYTYLKRYVDKMDSYISKRAGMSKEEFKLKTQQEYWIDSEDALGMHLLDEVVSLKVPKTFIFKFGNNKLRESIKLD